MLPDHVHVLMSIPPKYAVAQVVGFVKGKSAIHVARVFAGRRRNFVGQHLWARGYYVSTVGKDEEAVRAERDGSSRVSVSREAAELLHSYDWPDNVAQLAGVIDKAATLSEGAVIAPERLPDLAALGGRHAQDDAGTAGAGGAGLPHQQTGERGAGHCDPDLHASVREAGNRDAERAEGWTEGAALFRRIDSHSLPPHQAFES